MKLNKGDIIKHKDGTNHKVLAIADGAYYLQHGIYQGWYIDQEILDNYVLPKEEIKFIEGERYWYFYGTGEISDGSYCSGDFSDTDKLKFGNMFKTKAEAESARDAVRKLLLELRDK